MTQRSRVRSPYMEFAKLHSGAKYNLATSGIMGYSLRDLPVRMDDLEINGPTLYGYAPLIERIARKNGVARENVMYTLGTSMANQLAFAACTEPGEEVLVETPGYELIDSALMFLGTEVRQYERTFEDGYRLNVEEIERKITPKTKLIVVTNLHNPSGVLTGDATLRKLGQVARQAGARVLVDEVYLELLFDRKPPTAFHLDPDTFVVTNSLTKAFGLSGIRCGWVLADPELVESMWHLADIYYGTPVHAAELLGVIAFDNLDKVAHRAQSLLNPNRAMFNDFLDSRKDLECVRNECATTVFPRMLRGTVQDLDRLLREKYETSIVPGSYFGQAQHFRMGAGGDTEMTREGLRRLGLALDELS